MKKYATIIIAIVFVLAAIAAIRFFSADGEWICQNGAWIKSGNPSAPMPTTGCPAGSQEQPQEKTFTGRIIAGQTLTVESESGEKAGIILDPAAVITDASGNLKDKDFLKAGFDVEIKGTSIMGSDGQTAGFLAKEVRILNEPNIIVAKPQSGDVLGFPAIIQGEARVFENAFNYRIKDSAGNILSEGFGQANSPDIGLYGPFEVAANYAAPKTTDGIVEVFDYSAKDGSEIDKVVVPVKFPANVETMQVKAFFGSEELNPGALDCSKVFPVERRIPKTQAVARAALEELLKGPDEAEKSGGFITMINQGVIIQKLTIEGGIAIVDFDKTLEASVGGSCRVAAIRAQIENTLKQFPTVKEVIISIDGRTVDILQP